MPQSTLCTFAVFVLVALHNLASCRDLRDNKTSASNNSTQEIGNAGVLHIRQLKVDDSCCPPGWSVGFTLGVPPACNKPPSKGRGGGYPWKFGDGLNDRGMFKRCEGAWGAGNCEKCGAIVYPKCGPRFAGTPNIHYGWQTRGCNFCEPKCPPGFPDGGLQCTIPTKDGACAKLSK